MSKFKLNPPSVSPYTEKLMLQLLLEYRGFAEVFHEDVWHYDNIAAALGLPSEMERCDDFRAKVKKLLQARNKTLPKLTALCVNENSIIQQNIDTLTQLLSLNTTEQTLFRLSVQLRLDEPLKKLSEVLPKSNFVGVSEVLSNLFGLPKSDIISALKDKGKLLGYGLLERNYNPDSLHDYLDWGKMLDFDEFISEPLNKQALLKACTKPAIEPSLSLDDFAYLNEMKTMMLDYLQSSFATHRKGANILIYGAPGTGKTEFATLLAKAVSVSAHNITYMDENEEVIRAEERLNKCRFAQKVLEGQSSLLIFDEIEDVFRAGFFERSVAQKNKAWMNQLLENNNVPMIWLSNSVSGIDPAFLRRFDFILEMPDLPLKNKSALITQLAEGKLSPAYVQHFAKVRSLTPAILSRTIRVAKELNTSNFAETLLMMFNQTLKSQNKPKIEPLVLGKANYNLDYVACNDNIHRISEGLKRSKKGRICCYGPPGTGKTAWAAWLAEQLDMPLLLRQGSDLLDPYVGGTEQNIAQAFEQAKADNALLVLDEVDTFLFSRDGAERSWERSQVNEMLTQIERFEGLMVVSTNLIEVLDPAALRRFDLKLKFDYLTLKQRLDFAKQQAEILGLPSLSEEDLSQIESLNLLTPGDFAAVARRHQFSPFQKVQDWLSALQGECEVKPAFSSTTRRIGFF
ncbi:AAA family ATPase [uncultured Haemophilus sp.]|uniref:AAA family ATPase n=1 Tax=uncultured Haemophilus sp. TaxID=237779 RepID=UPI0025D4A13C|nr:AAA family ATPase [uncultured Haemophilus sp.]